ncbi:MAG TPA: membrane dipeptidase [Thermoanaerobaculia bacterium]|nr:membrane dipeptidase [Thermoanaerobaculia bacterium]
MKKLAIALVLFLGVLYVVTIIVVPPRVDRAMNRVLGAPPFDRASPRAEALHAKLTIADLHADSLIWGRDLLERNDTGQVDIPRLRVANVAIQVFSVPTQVPKTRSRAGTPRDQLDLLTVAAFCNAWPPKTWCFRDERAQHASGLLQKFADKSDRGLILVRTGDDLERALKTETLGGVLALEGLHALENDMDNVDVLFNAGYRIAGLVHQFDNELGGSSQGVERGGLTPFGRGVVERMEQRGMIIDLAHASPALIRDVVKIAKRPLLVSHTGVRGTCDRPRNLSDEEVRLVASTGGVIGIGFWSGAVCGGDASAIAKSIRHATNLVGVNHVALGSDFDGDKMPFDATGLVQITDALLADGFSEAEVEAIMGGNVIRMLREGLPAGG